jgi:hypothetical protein
MGRCDHCTWVDMDTSASYRIVTTFRARCYTLDKSCGLACRTVCCKGLFIANSYHLVLCPSLWLKCRIEPVATFCTYVANLHVFSTRLNVHDMLLNVSYSIVNSVKRHRSYSLSSVIQRLFESSVTDPLHFPLRYCSKIISLFS